ncbi:DUF4192 domain-containing protein [Streptomyces sp. NPDC048639]|uniref:DUF4192 domain-containing protein n=1 Tax=Streptomyces sp. NPDC048639 TaxID=3365581 RepID=UPI0037104AE7
MTRHIDPSQPSALDQITLRSPAELADALPYLMGFHPDDSIVLAALHGDHGRFGGRLRLGIPVSPGEWPYVADQLADCLVSGSEKRASRPDGIIVFLCQDPTAGEKARDVMERLRPLAQRLRTACGELDVPVLEALCISDGRFWSYCCPDTRCCPMDGTPLALPGTSVMAAAATFAGIQVRGSLREMEARLAPLTAPASAVRAQEEALDAATAELVPRILGGVDRGTVRTETLVLVQGLVERFGGAQAAGSPTEADAADDGLVSDEEAAAIILGLQDRTTRDRAAEWMEGPETEAALRVWRAIARRCVGVFGDHAAAPLTLAGWVAMSTGDEPAARVALGMALRVDPDYLFAKLLHQGANEGLDPELLRECLRQERDTRATRRPARMTAHPPSGRPRGRTRPGGHASRGRVRVRRRAGQRRA